MRRRRFFAVFSIFLLIFMQSTPATMQTISAEMNDHQFSLQMDEDSTLEKATLKIASLSEETYDVIHVRLPKESSYDQELTEQLEQKGNDITYKQEEHVLEIAWNNTEQNNATFIINDLVDTENDVTIQGFVDEELITEEKHQFTVVNDEDDTPNEDREANQGNEESYSNEKETKESESSETKEEESKSTQLEAKHKAADESETSEDEGDLNTYVGIGPVYKTGLTGADADFRFTMKLTGSKRTYKNVDVVIDLPLTDHITFDDSQDNLDRLAIDGVSPTFNHETNELTYKFNEIKRGQMYEKIISLNTDNGYLENGTEIEVAVKATGEVHYTENDEKEEAEAGDVVPFEYEDVGSMNLNASGVLSLSKYQVNESENNKDNGSVVTRGDLVLWKLELEIPKKDRGQLFLNPDKKIVVTDTLPTELSYTGVSKGAEPTDVDGQTITWEFSANDFEEQEEKGKTLYKTEIIIETFVKNNAPKGEVKNKAEASATFIDDVVVTDEAERSVRIAVGDPGSGEITGTIFVPQHIGPGGNNDTKNPRPEVTDDELLSFRHGIAPLPASFPDRKGGGNLGVAKNFQEYQTIYEIDENLNLETLRAPKNFRFNPNSSYQPKDDFFKVQPKYDIKAKIDGSSTYETLVKADDVVPGKTYTREELGIDSDAKVNEIRIEFVKGYDGNPNDVAPGGMQAGQGPLYTFSIDKGYRGEVENKFNVTGKDGNGKRFNDRSENPDRYDNSNANEISGPRQATVVGYGENPEPVGQVGVRLVNDINSVVTLGKNTMQLELRNINNSGAPMNKSLETVVLLPPGVKLHDEVNPSYTNAEGQSTDAASYEVLEENYNQSGRQLVKVKWDDSRITKGQNLQAELDVYIHDDAPSQLSFDVYGFSNDEGLKAPSSSGEGVTNTILQNDTENFYGEGENHPRLKSGNVYTLAGKYDVQTEKLIKGPEDEEYSKFTTAPFEGSVDYKLKLTNTTGKDLSMMTLIDVLPTVGDLGITDNVNRGSQFDPILEGPITLPEEWRGKVNVYYSTAKNPERDDLTRHTDYLPNTPQLTNPEGAEAPNWIKESEVTDWSTIHSFKIELQKGDTWIKGQGIEIDFSMEMPKEADVEDDVKDLVNDPYQRAAWNSFAVSTDTGQPVEPERVGVALELDPPETPDVEKEVEDNDGDYGKDLVEKEFEKNYNYQVNTTVPEKLLGYEYLSLTDTLDDRLNVIDAQAFVDGKEVNYEVTIEGQLVTLKVDREQLDKIAGQELTLQITAQIKEGTEVEVIDNKAEIQVNDNPSKDSNIVPVTPPPEDPGIEKDIDGEKAEDPVEKLRGETYEYNVTSTLPENVNGYEYVTIADELDNRLTIEGTEVLVNGEASDIEAVVDGQLVTVALDEEQVKELAGKEIQLVISAKINEDVEVEIINNQANIQVNDNPAIDSNIVPVMPPPEEPGIEKDIDGEKAEDPVVKLRGQEYEYNVTSTLPENVTGYKDVTITDELDERLTIEGTEVLVNGEASDIEAVVDEQLVTVTLDEDQIKEFAGKEIQLVITATINADTEIEVIDNQASIQVNDNPEIDSNIVPVIPPTTPNIDKDIEGGDHLDIDFDKEYKYNIVTELPTNIEDYERFIITDKVDSGLVVHVEGVKATVDGETYDGLTVTVDGNDVQVEVTDFDGLKGKEQIELVIPAKIHPDTNIDDYTDHQIPNTADLDFTNESGEDSKITTKPVTVTPPPTPDVEKEVEDINGEYGKDLVEKEFEQDYNYQVNTTVPEDLTSFEYLTLTDTLDDRLNVIKAQAFVDGEPVDYDVTIEDQLVTLKIDRAQLDDIAGQQLTLQITAQIKEGVEVEVIDNKAEIQVNDNPSKDSNIVPVTPPPENPAIEKDIDGEKAENPVEKVRGEAYEYNVTSTLPENVNGYEYVTITDELDDRLTIEGTKVLVDGEASDIEANVDGQLVTVSLDEEQVKELAGAEIQLVITAKINEDVEIEVIDNQASIQVNDNPEIDSNIVPVTPKELGSLEILKLEGTEEPEVSVLDRPGILSPNNLKEMLDEEVTLSGATFELRDSEGNVIVELTSDEDGHARADNIPAGDYILVEVESPDGYQLMEEEIEVTIVDQTVTDATTVMVYNKKIIPPTPIEPGTTEVDVEKVWEGEAQDSVTIHLLANGEKVDSIDLSKDNDWKHTFTDLPNIEEITDENEIKYTVEEVVIKGYESKITGNAEEGFVVTNTVNPPETPDVEKEVEDNEGAYGKDLVEKEFEQDYNYQINTTVPENLLGYEHITLTDTLDDRLNVIDAQALVDGEEVDYDVTIEGQLVTLKVDRAELDDIAGQQLTLQITAQIKEGTDVEIIDNKAEIQVNDSPSKDSNIVPVTPPPENPAIEKDIDGEKAENPVEKVRGEAYEYNVTSTLPENVNGYEYVTITDELDDRLTIEGTKVLVDGEASDIEANVDGQLVTVSLDEEQVKELAGAEIQLVITAKINEDVELEVIDNQASIQVNDNPTIDSNIVPVTPPPPTTPEIEKDVEGETHFDVDYDKEYKYNITTAIPSNIENYEKFIITDQVDKGLVVDADKVFVTVDGEVYNGLQLTIDGNDVRVEVTDFDGLKDKGQIELVITAKIPSDTSIDDYTDNKIPNTADVHFTNESGVVDQITTKPVTVTPPPTEDPEPSNPSEPPKPSDPEDPKDPGETLPKTATNMFNIMLIGITLLLIGIGSICIRRHIKQ